MADTQMTLEEALAQAISHHQAGRLGEAEAFYRAILQSFPAHPSANHNLGVIALQSGKPLDALPHFQAAIIANPGQEQYRLSLAEALLQAGMREEAKASLHEAMQRGFRGAAWDSLAARLAAASPSPQEMQNLLFLFNQGRIGEAEAAARSLAARFPEDADLLNNLGVIRQKLGHLDDAEAAFRRAIELKPDFAVAHYNLGNVLNAAGRQAEAENCYRQATSLDPNHADAHCNLAVILAGRGYHIEAEAEFRRAITSRPDFAGALSNLGSTLLELGRLDESVSCCRQATELAPGFSEAHFNLGNALREQARLPEAEAAFRKTIELAPEHAKAFNNLGLVLNDLGRFEEAESCYRRALKIKADFAEALGNLGSVLCRTGKVKTGIIFLRQALEIDPELMRFHGSLIFFMDLASGFDTAMQQSERKIWAARHAAPLFVERKFTNSLDPERILRIGYVSADFREHSASNGFASLLGQFDREHFEVYAYSNSPKVDEVTRSLQSGVSAWREIYQVSDEDAAELIVKDGIDILVDLSGHTMGNRLMLFARKPAPIQVSAMGYPTGTGMKAMDAIFVDPIVVPPDEAHLYAEEIRHLPCLIDYSAKRDFPEANELPVLSNGTITFGSFNRLPKISEETLHLWARLLQAQPESRLVIKAAELDVPSTKSHIFTRFENCGIAPERVALLGKTSWLEHISAYNLVDISLDPFPHGGGVTTIESIMMGAPVLTLRYPTFVGRASASILTTLDLSDWIAESVQDYIRIACEKSRNLEELVKLRQSLRGRFQSSLLGKTDYYVREAEKQYRALWRRWCAKQGG